jgi:hypothetical protein
MKKVKDSYLYRLYQKHVLGNLDKIVHFLLCFFFVTVIANWLPWEVALAFVALIGIGKEFWDEKYTGIFSYLDLVSDFIGIFSALYLILF